MIRKEGNEDLLSPNTTKWPFLLCIPPKAFLLAILFWLVFAWTVFIVVDILGVVDLGINRPMWLLLFNDRPVEWTQWFLFVFAVVASAYLAGRLDASKRVKVARFFFLFSIGLGLMLIEDAGDIRHVISREVQRVAGSEIMGVHFRVVSDVPYFTALAFIPVYAVLRYGRYVWESTKIRFYLASGFLLYAIAAMGSGIRHLGGFYITIGAWIDRTFFGNQFPVPEGMTQERAHFFIVDSVIEESIELLALTMIFAAILAYAYDVRLMEKTKSA